MPDQEQSFPKDGDRGPTEVIITPLPIVGIVGCCVPIVPGTEGDTAEPIDKRTELCAIDANWIIGAIPTCDVHLRVVADQVGWDWSGLVEEAERDLAAANRPWGERERHSQEHTRANEARFLGGPGGDG